MEPWVLKALALLIGTILGIIGYFLKKRIEKIEAVEKEVNTLKNKFSVLEEKLQSLENTNLPILMEIKKELGEVKTNLSVLQSELKSIQKYSDKQDLKIEELNKHYHRRKTDPLYKSDDE